VLKRRSIVILLAAAAAAVGVVFVSNALSAGSAPSTIQACVKTKSGSARIVSSGKRCMRGERAVRWQKVGQIGAPGANGAAGAKGDTGPKGATGATGPAGIADFNDLQGMPCTRDAQHGTIDLSFGAGGLVRPRCRLAGDGPVCGDGVTEGSEQCDDGNDNPTDGCTNTCTVATCGDGVIHTGSEQCDSDGNDSSICNGATCTVSRCGDGHINAAAGEQCDGSGESALCNADCSAATCGDGKVNRTAGEQCDDGNSVSGDGCNNDCQYSP
jgi:cysteine-rich repeat protein